MKKTVQVNIGGCAFNIDEDSYSIIDEYLGGLKRYYSGTLDGKEIVEDIEERMAELLIERCGTGNVVSAVDARYVIGVLGTPASFGDESAAEKTKSPERLKKRLYRNPDGKVIAGVCSGLAAYLNCDVTLIRLIGVILFVATIATGTWVIAMPLLYSVCWLAMPMADTVQKQCEMRGETVSAAGIEQKIKSGKVTTANPSGRIAGRILGFICGLVLFLAGLSALGSGIFVATLPALAWLNADIASEITRWCAEFGFAGVGTLGVTTMIVAGIVYFIPCILAMYYGILLMFGLKSPRWRPGLILLIIWAIALMVLIPLLAMDCAALIPHL